MQLNKDEGFQDGSGKEKKKLMRRASERFD